MSLKIYSVIALLGVTTSLFAVKQKDERAQVEFEADYVALLWRSEINHLRVLYQSLPSTTIWVEPISQAKVTFDYAPGVRAAALFTPLWYMTFEMAYMGLFNWHSSASSASPNYNLIVPTKPFASNNYEHGYLFNYQYASKFNSAVLGYWQNFNPRLSDMFSLSMLVGLRYLGLIDRILITLKETHATDDYYIKVRNHFVGGELGFDFASNMNRFISFACQGRFGAYGNMITKWVNLLDDNNTTTLFHGKLHATRPGFSIDITPSVTLRLGPVFFRTAYDYLLIFYAAVAPKQPNAKNDVNRIYTKHHTSMQSVEAGFGVHF